VITHTHTHTHARARARTHARTHARTNEVAASLFFSFFFFFLWDCRLWVRGSRSTANRPGLISWLENLCFYIRKEQFLSRDTSLKLMSGWQCPIRSINPALPEPALLNFFLPLPPHEKEIGMAMTESRSLDTLNFRGREINKNKIAESENREIKYLPDRAIGSLRAIDSFVRRRVTHSLLTLLGYTPFIELDFFSIPFSSHICSFISCCSQYCSGISKHAVWYFSLSAYYFTFGTFAQAWKSKFHLDFRQYRLL